MTPSHMDLMLSDLMRSVQQCREAPSLSDGLLKGLILKQEIEDRDERKDGSDCSTMNKEHSGDIPS